MQKVQNCRFSKTNSLLKGHHSGNLEMFLEQFCDLLNKKSNSRPLDLFDVNYATTASLTGLITTYVIVLLQFKLSEA